MENSRPRRAPVLVLTPVKDVVPHADRHQDPLERLDWIKAHLRESPEGESVGGIRGRQQDLKPRLSQCTKNPSL